MSLQRPLEGLLRPPLEWYTTAVSCAGSVLLIVSPEVFLLPPSWAYTLAVLLLVLGLIRFKQGYRVYRYQRNLKRMPRYQITSKQIPTSTTQLFLGKGFLWTSQHTQRLRDLDLPYNLHYKNPSPLKQWAWQKELAWAQRTWLKWGARFLSADVFCNPFRPYPPLGGHPCIHGVSEKEEDIAIPLNERASHLVVVGLPGTGKTRFAELLITQDIRRGDVVIVIDPKGDADLLKRIYVEAFEAGRGQDLLIFHLGFPHRSCRYNPIGNFTRVTEVANRISNQLPSSGDSAAFKEFGWQFINSIAMALVSIGEKPNYQKMKFYITKMDVLLEKYLNFWLPSIDAQWEPWITAYIREHSSEKKIITRLQAQIAYVQSHELLNNPIFDDLHHACKYNKEYFSKITASLGPLLKKLTTGQVAKLLSPNYADLEDSRPILDWLQVIRNKQIVYVGLDSLTDREVSAAVGNALFADLVSVAGRLYKHGVYDGFYKTATQSHALPRICLHSDEFNEIIGDEFIPLLNKARGAGFTVTAYTQTWSDVEARLKTSAKAGQVAGNLGTVIMFRCKEAKTVEMLLQQLPAVPIYRVIPASSSQDNPKAGEGVWFNANQEDRLTHSEQRFIEQNDVLNLCIGHAFILVGGGQFKKSRMPLLLPDNRPVPEDIAYMLEVMRNQ